MSPISSTSNIDETNNMEDPESEPRVNSSAYKEMFDKTNEGVDDVSILPSKVDDQNPVQGDEGLQEGSVDDFCQKRARKNWNFVKHLVQASGKQSKKSKMFKMGEQISLTTAEATFLNMMAKSKLKSDHAEYEEEKDHHCKVGGGETHFVDLVKAAVAKERLRDAITERLSHLSGPEVKFLAALVKSDDVSLDALENAVHVLDNDPLYNPSLRNTDDEGEEETPPIGPKAPASTEGKRRWNRKSSIHEKSMWKLCNAEASENKETSNEGDIEMDGRKRGSVLDAISGIASEAAEETTGTGLATKKDTNTETKIIDSVKERVGDNESKLESRNPSHEQQSAESDAAEINRENEKEQSSSSIFCCAFDSLTTDDPDASTVVSDEPVEEDNFLDKSLGAKRRYLHLDNNATVDRQSHLSTWLGSPDDYPILGLKSSEDGENGNDTLEPHVLSPLLMKCLREHFPFSHKEENFWLKYSLVRDGASLEAIFSTLRHSQHTILAIETVQGEVFGSFTSSPWRSNGNNYYGSCEAFVWMLRKPRRNNDGEGNCDSLDEYIIRESSLEVFPWSSKEGNRNVQLSNPRKLYVGGGEPDDEVMENVIKFQNGQQSGQNNGKTVASEKVEKKVQWGMALAVDKELLYGTSSCCATFSSGPLIDKSRDSDSSVFEIMNMEVWALTPCMTEEAAQELELGRTFVMGCYK